MRLRLALVLSILGTLSCSGDAPTEGAALSGTFDLVTIDGVPPPRLELVNMSLDSLFFTGAELRTLSRGRMSVVRRRRWHTAASGPLAPEVDSIVVEYRLTGTELLLDFPVTVPYGPYTDTATVQGDAVTVRTKVYGLQQGAVLVRQLVYVQR